MYITIQGCVALHVQISRSKAKVTDLDHSCDPMVYGRCCVRSITLEPFGTK